MAGFIKGQNTIKESIPVKSEWGAIVGDIVDQTDIVQELAEKEVSANKENVVLDTSSSKYPTNNLVKQNLDLKSGTAHLHTGVYEEVLNKNVNNGYAGLDAGGKLESTLFPAAVLIYKGVWNAATNTPTLTTPNMANVGFVYVVTEAGTQFGKTWLIGEWAIYNDAGVLEQSKNGSAVISVNGQQGAVVLTTTEVTEGAANKYVTTADKAIWNAKETGLGNPTVNGQMLSSTIAGVRSWSSPSGVADHNTAVNRDLANQHVAAAITESETKQFVTAAEKELWNGILDATDILPASDAYDGVVPATFAQKIYGLIKLAVAGFNQSTPHDVIFNWKSPSDADPDNLLFKYRIYLSPDNHLGTARVNSAWLLKTLRAMGIDLNISSFSGTGTRILTDADMRSSYMYKSDWSETFTIADMEQGDFVLLNLIRSPADIADTYAGVLNVSHIEVGYKRGPQVIPTPPIPPVVIYVNALATGANNGTSWANAYSGAQGLRTAITNSLSGDEIWVARGGGAYYRAYASPDRRPHDINKPLSIYGGFSGIETSRIQRNPSANITYITGGTATQGATNSYHVLYINSDSVIIDGFHIYYGHANGTTTNAFGANVYVVASKFNIKIENCTLKFGSAVNYGGGLFVDASAQVSVINSIVDSNIGVAGAGVYGWPNSIISLTGVWIKYNSIYNANSYATALFANACTISAIRCIFEGNTGSTTVYSRAIYVYTAVQARFKNCLFYENTSSFGIASLAINAGTDTQIINCTFRKSTGNYSALYIYGGTTAALYNCNFWGNTGVNPVYNDSATVTVKNCNYQSWGGRAPLVSENNTLVDPLFVDTTNSRLQNTSPCKNTGNNTYIAGEDTDLDSNPRIVNVTVDKGCYENQVG